MALHDDVDAIWADTTRSPKQRYVDAATLKASAIGAAIAGLVLPQTWVRGLFSLTLHSATATGTRVVLVLTVTRAGVRVPINNPVIIENPPILVPDPAGPITRGGQKVRLDLVGAARAVLESLIAA